MAGVTAADLDAIVYANCTPDAFLPGNGIFLQRELGAGQIPALDIRMQCSGFIYALQVADAFVRLGTYRFVLVVGQEVQSTRMDVSTRGRGTAVIFADGAGAVVARPPRRRPIVASWASISTVTVRSPRSSGPRDRARSGIRRCRSRIGRQASISSRWTGGRSFVTR